MWTLFTKPLTAKLGVGLPELQVTFSLLVFLQAFFSPSQVLKTPILRRVKPQGRGP